MNQSETFNHKAAKDGDEEFIQRLQDFLGGASPPVFYTGVPMSSPVDREKTLALPCYEGFKEGA